MSRLQELHAASITLQAGEHDQGAFDVVAYRGSEGLSRLYRFEIELTTADRDAPQRLVGVPGRLTIQTPQGRRSFHGLISRCETVGAFNGRVQARVELVPLIWTLTQRSDARIFQQKTTLEIFRQVCEAAGIPSDYYDFDLLQGEYLPREYCVQYRETDYNFLARLLEEEGIWWFFEQREETHVLRLADSRAAYARIEGESARLPFEPPNGLLSFEEHVARFRLDRALRPTAAALNDFDFKKPRLPLLAESTLEASPADAQPQERFEHEFYDYPGEYERQAVGVARAKIRVEELATFRRTGIGQSNSRRLSPGRVFTLYDHPVGELNNDYLVTAVTYSGKQASRASARGANGTAVPMLLEPDTLTSLRAARQEGSSIIRQVAEAVLQLADKLRPGDPTAQRERTSWLYHGGQVVRDGPSAAAALGGNLLDPLTIPNLLDDSPRDSAVHADESVYACRFECIPADVTFRAPRVTAWPLMRGTQTAIVVGPSQEEIYTDEYGRVKVRFHWDRDKTPDEQASCWIRVSQGWAGGRYGMIFLPRVGHEVIVDFLEGDPDKPIIVGRVYNGDHMPPYSLPGEKTKSTIKTLSSPADKRYHEIRFEDRKGAEQLFMRAQRRMDTRVVGPHFHTTAGSLHELIGGKTKDGPKGGYYRTAYENVDLRVQEGAQLEFVQKERNTVVAGNAIDEFLKNLSVYVDGSLQAGVVERIALASKTEIAFWVGNSFIRITEQGVEIQGEKILLNCDDAQAPAAIPELPDFPEAMEASPADDGVPGRAGRGRGQPRGRRTRRRDAWEGPVVIKQPPPPKPKKPKALTLTADCEHDTTGARQIHEDQVLEVVPQQMRNYTDPIQLTAESRPLSAKEPEWLISGGVRGGGHQFGYVTSFTAEAPKVGQWQNWIPKRTVFRNYYVTCRDGNGQQESLLVRAYPPMEQLLFNERELQRYIDDATVSVRKVLDFFGSDFKFKLPSNIKFNARAGNKEDADAPTSYFAFELDGSIDPLLKGEADKPFALSKLALKSLPGWVQTAAAWVLDIIVTPKIEGQVSVNLQAEGRYRNGKWTLHNNGSGVTGTLELSLSFSLDGLASEVVGVGGGFNGTLVAEGKPFADDHGYGVEINVSFKGLTGHLEVDLPFKDPKKYEGTIYAPSDPVIFGPRKLYVTKG